MKMPFKTRQTSILGTIAGCVMACTVHAESRVSSTITATSDYVADGVSQSDSRPVLQIGLDYVHDSGLYAGIWGSRIDNDAPATPNMELDYALGFAKDYSDALSYDLGVTQYTYHHVNDKDVTNYHEWYVGLIALKNTSFYYYYADDEKVWGGIQRRMIVSHTQSLTDNVSLLFLAERLSYEESFGEDYSAYQIGITKTWMDTDFTLSYWDNNIKNGGDATGDRFVLDISHTFD